MTPPFSRKPLVRLATGALAVTLGVVLSTLSTGSVLAQDKPTPGPTPPAPTEPPHQAPPKRPVKEPTAPAPDSKKKPSVTCTLLTTQVPRGGRLEVQGEGFGKAPVVKIGGEVTRMIERPGDRIAVQVPRKSDGGEVVVRVGGNDVPCGTLTIVGLD